MTAPDRSGITDLSLLRQRGRPHMRLYRISPARWRRASNPLWSRCLFGNGDTAISWIQTLAVALLLAAAVVSAILINSN
jgi:hypothetical protein